MNLNLIQIRQLAEDKEDENWRFRRFLKDQFALSDTEIDRRVSVITKQVWSGIDCTACANCCREVHPTFNEEELTRVAQRLGLTRQDFIAKYLEATNDSGSPFQTRSLPCPFLINNQCSIYDDRPADCRGYPYLDQPDFLGRTMAMIERTFTCPIAFEVMEQLKASCNFPRRHDR